MTNSHDSTNSARLDEVLLDYLRRVDRREPVDREAFIAEHPDVAEQLRAFFADSSAVDNLLHVKPERPRASRDGPRVSALPVVRYFGDYELLEEVGRGGMGVVYKARQCSLNRTVAVKMILAGQLADEEEVRRFQAEAELAAGLDHPGIVPIFEVGRHEGQCYFSMAYVEGRSLAQEVAQAPLPPRRAAERMCRVAQAVHYAHGKGVIHRDLKPSNILLDANDQPRITDFGLARRVAVDGGQTASGQILGSPSYMPPEQAEGRLDRIDARSDVYALGATLYHLITGRAPFQAAHVLDTLAQVRREDPLAPRQINPRLPRDLDTICLKCLEKSPHRRFSTVDEFREELQRFLDGKPILSRPVSGPERAWRWCRRNPALAALTAVMLLVGVLLGLGAPLVAWRQAVLRQQAEQAQEAAEQAQQTAEDARQTAEAAGKDAERSRQETARQAAMEKEARERALDENRRAEANLYYSRIALARQQFFANHVAEAEAHLDACAPQHRHWEWGYLKRLCHRDLWTINTNPHFVILLALSQDGKQVLCGDYDGHFRVWDAASGKELRTIVLFSADPAANSDSSRPYEPAALAVSADGKWIAGGRKTAGLWDAVTGKRAQSFDAGAIEGVAFSPDATQVAIASQGKVLVYDTATGRRQLTIAGGYHGEIVFSPDGKSLARGDSEGIRIWDTATGQDKASLKKRRPADTSTFDIAGGLAFSPDGKRIAAGCPDRAVSIWDTSTNQEVMRLTGHDQGVHHLAFSADGKRIVTAGGDQTVRVWDADTGRQVLLLRGHRHIVDKVAVSADGTRITSAGHDGTVRMWDATLEQETRTPRCDAGDLEHLAFDPRGKQLAAGAGMGGVVVWDFATGKEVFRQDSSFSVRIGEPGRHSRSKDDVPESEDDISKSEDDMPRSEDNMFGHGVVFGPDGQWLASGGSGGQVAFWQPASGKKLFTLRPSSSAGLVETSSISNVALRPDGKRIALAGDDVIVVWDIATRRQVLSIRESGPAGNETTRNPLAFMQQVQFSPDGRTIAAQTPRGGVKTWDAVTGKEIGVIPTQEGVLDLAFSPDSRLLAIADTDVVVWDLAKRRKVAQFGGRSGHGVPCLAFSPDGRRLACDAGDALEIREVGSWREVLSLPRSASMLWRLAFSPDGSCIAAAGDNGTATVWQGMTSMEMTGGATVVPAAEPAATPPPAARLSVPEAKPEKGSPPPEDEAEEKPMDLDGDDPPNDMPEDKPSAAPPGNAADAPARTTVRQPEGNAPAAQRNAKVPVAPEVGPEIRLELRHQVKAVCVSPDESWVALTGDDETVEIWDLRTKGQRLAFHAHKDGVNDIAVSADGKRLVTAGKDGFARVWDAATGKPLLEVTANTQHPRHVTAAAFRPDGRQFATAAEHRITLWDATSGAPSLTLEPPVGSVGFRESVLHLAFDASGKQLASATFQEGTRVWDAVQGGMIAQVGKDQRSSIAPAFSPDGKQLASGGENGTVTIWDLATGKPVHKLPKCRGDAGCLAFSADGQILATGSPLSDYGGYGDGGAKIWDLGSGKSRITLGRAGLLPRRAFLDGGRKVLYYDRAGNVRVYDTAVAKEPETPVRRTPRAVRTVAFSPHGKWLAAGGDSKTVQLVDLTTRGVFLTLRGHLGIVTGLAFSPDGKRVASCSPDATARIWDLDAGRAVLTLDGRGQGFLAIAFSPDGKQVATAGEDGEVRLWATSDGRPGAVLGNHAGAVHALAFSPDGRWMASAGDDRGVRLWDLGEGRETKVLRGHQGKVTCVAFSPDGQRIVSGGWDQTIIVWDRKKDGPLLRMRDHACKISAVGFSPDGQRIASAGWDGIALVWDAATGQRLLQCGGRQRRGIADDIDHRLNCLAFCREGKRLALGYADGRLPVCQLSSAPYTPAKSDKPLRPGVALEMSEDGAPVPEMKQAAATFAAYGPGGIHRHEALRIYTMAVRSIVFAPDGKRFATLGGEGQIKVWNWPELTEIFRAGGIRESLESLSAAVFSSDSRQLAATGGQKVTVWDSANGTVISVRDLEDPSQSEGPLVFSADGKQLAMRPYSEKPLRLWNAATGKALPPLTGLDGSGAVFSFHPDGTRLLTGDHDWTLRVWNLQDRKIACVARGHSHYLSCGAFTPDGTRFVSVGDKTLRMWDSATAAEIYVVPAGDGVRHLAFNPAGTHLATAGAGNTVVVRDVATGRRLLVCRGHSTPVHSIAFHPDGRALISGDGEGMVKVWKKAAAQETAPQGKL